jgi:hypothetical protein
MRSVARTLELSIAANSASANEDITLKRAGQIAQIRKPLTRTIANSIDRFAVEHPLRAKTALDGLAFVIGGYRYLGNGSMTSVYKRGSDVFKVYRHTATMSGVDRKNFVDERNKLCSKLAKLLGNVVVGQEVVSAKHPLGGYKVAIAKQPYVPGNRLDLFATNVKNK